MNTFLIIGLFLAAALASHTFVVWLAARLSKLPRRGWWRAFIVVVVRLSVMVGVWVLINYSSDQDETMMQFFTIALMFDVVVCALLLWWLCRGGFPKLFGAWAGVYVATVALFVVINFGIRPFLWMLDDDGSGENSMSPNIRGYHLEHVLPDGKHLLIHTHDPRYESTSR